MEFAQWSGLFAPSGTPEPILKAIGAQIRAMAKSPEISERLSKVGIVPGGLSEEECEAVFEKDHKSFAAAIKAAGIAPPQ